MQQKMPAMKKRRTQENYNILSQQEQILRNPDMFVGKTSCKTGDANTNPWSYYEDGRLIEKDVIPALWKLFDEVAQNVIDVYQKNSLSDEEIPVTNVKIEVSDDTISVWNNGSGVPIEKSTKASVKMGRDVLCPELVWFHFGTGDNLDTEDRMVGGKNGYGSKLCGVFSTKYEVKTCDGKQRFSMVAKKNMTKVDSPKVKVANKNAKSFTEVKFKIDLKQFKLNNKAIDKINDDTKFAIEKRVQDMANFMPNAKVYFNKVKVKRMTPRQHSALVVGKHNILFQIENDNQFICVASKKPDAGTGCCAYTNGIFNRSGGIHVTKLLSALHTGMGKLSKEYTTAGIHRAMLKRRLLFYIVYKNVVNPMFDGQCKDSLTDCDSGSKPPISYQKENHKVYFDKLRRQLRDYMKKKSKDKETNEAKKSDGIGCQRYVNVTDLMDARFAGTGKSHECALFITEGKSAARLASAMCPKDKYGVLPIRGKFLNAAKNSKVVFNKNAEVIAIKQTLGLKQSTKDAKNLRYGKVIIFTDQDDDGYHIRLLLMSMFCTHWPELVKNGFLHMMETPIVKANKGSKTIEFYDQDKAEKHMRENQGWNYRYYKGLGTSTAKDAKEYFKNRHKLIKKIHGDQKLVKKAMGDLHDSRDFRQYLSKGVKKCDMRDRGNIEFIVKRQFAAYAYASNLRKIPSEIDGLVPAMRKVLYYAIKYIKGNDNIVDRLANRAADKTRYHHGSNNLIGVIVNMASDYVGGIQVPFFQQNGQFASRHDDEHAAGRYIKTGLMKYIKLMFPESDMSFYPQQMDEGEVIEPVYMVPIVPLLLVNGHKGGLGCGYASEIPPHDMRKVIKLVKQYIEKKDCTWDLQVFYKNFRGTFDENFTYGKYTYNETDSSYTVTELPIGVKTDKFIANIKKVTKHIEFMDDHKSGDRVHLKIYNCEKKVIEKLMKKRIRENISVLGTDGEVKHTTYNELLKKFMDERRDVYCKRKANLASQKLVEYSCVEVKRRIVDTFLKKVWKPEDVSDDKGIEEVCRKLNSGFEFTVKEKDLDVSIRKLNKKYNIFLEKKSKELLAEHHAILNKPVEETWIEELDALQESLYPKLKKKRTLIDLS